MPIHEEEVNFHCFSNSFKIFFLRTNKRRKKVNRVWFFWGGGVYWVGLLDFFVCKRTIHCHFPALLGSKVRLIRKQKAGSETSASFFVTIRELVSRGICQRFKKREGNISPLLTDLQEVHVFALKCGTNSALTSWSFSNAPAVPHPQSPQKWENMEWRNIAEKCHW